MGLTLVDTLHHGGVYGVNFWPENDGLDSLQVLEGGTDDGDGAQRIPRAGSHHRRRVEARVRRAIPPPREPRLRPQRVGRQIVGVASARRSEGERERRKMGRGRG